MESIFTRHNERKGQYISSTQPGKAYRFLEGEWKGTVIYYQRQLPGNFILLHSTRPQLRAPGEAFHAAKSMDLVEEIDITLIVRENR